MRTLRPDERHEFARELVAAGRLWRGLLTERLKAFGITAPHWGALYWLSREQTGLSQVALAERAAVEPATLVRTLDQLEKQGMVVRRACATDRRVNLLHLTEAGQAAVVQIDAVADEVRMEIMEGLNADEVRAGMKLLRSLRSRLEATSASGSDRPGRMARQNPASL